MKEKNVEIEDNNERQNVTLCVGYDEGLKGMESL